MTDGPCAESADNEDDEDDDAPLSSMRKKRKREGSKSASEKEDADTDDEDEPLKKKKKIIRYRDCKKCEACVRRLSQPWKDCGECKGPQLNTS